MASTTTRSSLYGTNVTAHGLAQRLEAMNGADDPDFGPADLREFARQAAMAELLGNWRDALQDGASLASLLGDIDGVVENLLKFKAGIKTRFAADLAAQAEMIGDAAGDPLSLRRRFRSADGHDYQFAMVSDSMTHLYRLDPGARHAPAVAVWVLDTLVNRLAPMPPEGEAMFAAYRKEVKAAAARVPSVKSLTPEHRNTVHLSDGAAPADEPEAPAP